MSTLAAVPPGQAASAFQGAAVLAGAVLVMLGIGLVGYIHHRIKNRRRR